MAFIQWKNDYSVGNAVIDTQHKKLFQLINELHDSMKVGKSKDILNKTIDELTNYTIHHFNLEEKLMQKNNYPEFAGHKKGHTDFTIKVKAFKKDFENSSSVLSIEVLNFLRDWLTYHIKGMDKLYAPYIAL